jgi:glutamate dehydrogenase (NAD(P)+)
VLQDVGLVHLPDSTVVIQGFGAVGRHAAMALQGRGAKVIAVSDIGGATYNREGLDIESLVHFKGSSSVRGLPGGRPVPRDDILRLKPSRPRPAGKQESSHGSRGDRPRPDRRRPIVPPTVLARRVTVRLQTRPA